MRELIFKFFFYIGTILICLVFIPALLLPQKIILIGGKILGYWIKFCLYVFLSVRINVKGIENIPKDKPFFIASLHQSLIETFFFTNNFQFTNIYFKKRIIKYSNIWVAFKKNWVNIYR